MSPEQLALRAATILLSPFTPMLFMGEEFGARTPFPFFVSHTDDELARMTREGRLQEFARQGWNYADVPDPLDPKTFESARLDWEFEKEQVLLHDAYRELLEIRRTRGFNREDLRELQVEHGETWLTMRDAAEGSVTFAANFSDAPVTVPVGGELVYSFTTPKVGAEETVLDPWGFAVLA